MKKIGLNIAIGANIGSFTNKLGKVGSSIGSVAKRIEKLQNRKIKLITEDATVMATSKKLDTLCKRIDTLKKKKIDLQAKLSTAKSKKEIDELKAKINQTTQRIKVMNNNRFTLRDKLKSAKSEAEQTNSAVRKIERTVQRINNLKMKIAQTKQRGDNFKNNMMGNVARVGAVAMPIKMGVEFESAMARVKAITMATETDFKKLESTALKLGSSTTFTSTQVAEGMQYLSMAGFKTNETIGAMPGVLNLASAGAVDLATTSDIASNVLSGFKIKAEKMGMVADVMAKAITSANIDVVSMGETMKYAATPAQSLGESIQTVTALTGKLGDIGIKGGEAGTALRSMYLRMASPPKEAQKVVEKLGLTLKDSKGNFVGMVNVLGQLHKKTKNMGNTVKADYMKKLFGTEAVSAAIALTDKADGTLKKYTQTLIESSGFAQKMADIQNNTTAGALKKLGSAVEGIAIKFSTIFTPAITAVANKLSSLGSWLGIMMDKYPKLTQFITVATVALLAGGVALGAVGLAAGLAANGVRVLGLAFLANPIGLAIAGVVTAMGALWYYWDDIKAKIGQGVAWLVEKWRGFKESFLGIVEGIKSGISALNPLTAIQNQWNGVSNFFENFSLRDAGAKIITSVVDGFKSKMEYLKGKVANITKTIRDYFPFSPAKRGALRDIHKIKLLETVASGLNEKPLLSAVNNTTSKVRKSLAIGASLAVASPGAGQAITVNFNGGINVTATDGKVDTISFKRQMDQAIQEALNNRGNNDNRMYD